MIISDANIYISNSTFDHNFESLYTLNSILTFSGIINITNGAELLDRSGYANYKGGAITGVQSAVFFTGLTILTNNKGRLGGAIEASESMIMLYGETVIDNNTEAGIHLRHSNLDIKGNCNITSNRAMKGGGIHSRSSVITLHQQGVLQFINNSAKYGGGLYLEVNSKLYILQNIHHTNENLLAFTNNYADYGGAVYVADDTNSCAPDTECFIQSVVVHIFRVKLIQPNIVFSENTAAEQGYNLFGGILDRCSLSGFL